jgi:hypothetical protein
MRRILIVAAVIVLAGLLAAGTWQVAYAQGQASGRTAVAAARADFIQNRPGGAGTAAGGAGGPGAAAAGRPGGGPAPIAGTVQKIEGSTLTVVTDGGNVAVALGDQTQIRRQAPASASDLKAGDRVLVTGARDAGGGVAAATVQIQGQ